MVILLSCIHPRRMVASYHGNTQQGKHDKCCQRIDQHSDLYRHWSQGKNDTHNKLPKQIECGVQQHWCGVKLFGIRGLFFPNSHPQNKLGEERKQGKTCLLYTSRFSCGFARSWSIVCALSNSSTSIILSLIHIFQPKRLK